MPNPFRKSASDVRSPIPVSALASQTFISISDDLTVGQAIQRVRTSARRGHIFYLYVVDSDQRLCGIVSIRNLLVAADTEPLTKVMSFDVVKLPETTLLSDAYAIFARSRFLSLPVVNNRGEIRGVINAHELIAEYGKTQDELFEERSRGELFELLGIKAENEQKSSTRVAMGRLPWLLVNVVGGSLSAVFIHTLSGKLARAVEFLAFVPVLLVMAESVGMQTASVVIANLQRASAKLKMSSVIAKEALVALQLGLACGVPLAVAVWFGYHSLALSLAIGLTVPIAAVGVCSLGGIIPSLFHRFEIDPRISAGPVLLAVADCSTLLLYLLLAIFLTHHV